MKGPVKISVIVPVYNVEDYLPFALQSLTDQTLVDAEFICVNDGSTDNSLRILKEYKEKDDRFIIIDKENGGVSSARNEGLRVAGGKWIMFLDPDDYLSKNACERVWIEGEEGKTDIINFGTEIVPNQPRASEWHYYALNTPTKRYYEFTPFVLFGEPSAKPFIWHQAYSKQLLDKVGASFDESLKLGEDMAFLINLYPHAQAFAFIEDKLYSYRVIRKNSAMQVLRKNVVVKMKQHISVINKVFKHWLDNGFTEKYGKDLLEWALEFIVFDIEEADTEPEVKAVFATKLNESIEQYELSPFVKRLGPNGKHYYKALKAFMKG